MFEQLPIYVSNPIAARRFYDAIAVPLGLGRFVISDDCLAIETSDSDHVPMLWIGSDRPAACAAVARSEHLENLISFSADSRQAVDAFHAAALRAGGRNLRKPDVLVMQPGAYSAFVRDPSGNAVEACFAS
jgi:predicted lactoylglutathione lyase